MPAGADTWCVGTHERFPLGRPGGLDAGGLGRRAWPFLGLMAVGFVAIPLPPESGEPAVIVAAGVALALVVLSAATVPWGRIAAAYQVLPMLGCLVVVGLLRDSEGGAVSGVGPMALVPVFWCAMYGSRGQLVVVLAGVAAVFAVPAAMIGSPHYPVTEWERAILWSVSGLVFGLAVQSLVARIREQAQQLAALADTDPLTGLANRRLWDEAVLREAARARRLGEPLCVALLEVDGFKRLSDVHGVPAADRFLRKLATRWSAQLRNIDVLARVDGDRLGLLLPGLHLSEAETVAARLQSVVPNEQAVSVGLVVTDGREHPGDLVVRADEELSGAKRTRAVASSSAHPQPS
jgi:diguanylate cyclase (GGDEF)-like protein